MIRAALISLCLATPLAAQTPVETSAANDLRTCILDVQGFRDVTRLGQFDVSIQMLRDGQWGQLTEIAPGVFRLQRRGTDRIVEIKLPDANGSAHCMIFGPSIGPGVAALTADKFANLSFMPELTPAQPAAGMTRRYSVTGAPYQADLVAMVAPQVGEVVGFMVSGVPRNQTTRQLSSGDPSVQPQNVSRALSNALDVCLRNYFSRASVDAAVAAHGFQLGHQTGGTSPTKVYFSPDNAVSARIGPGSCQIDTNYMSQSATTQLTGAALNRLAPGGFSMRRDNRTGCVTYFAGGSINLPLSININNSQHRYPAPCADDGTSTIGFVVAG
ncbi:MAG: hypothetical protein AB8B47_12140 [Roseobacter sp.]